MSKKTRVITFRTTEEIYSEIEFRAEKQGWTVSQYVGKIITEKIQGELDTMNDMAKILLSKIDRNEIQTYEELVRWAISTGNLEEVICSGEIWRELLREKNVSKGGL